MAKGRYQKWLENDNLVLLQGWKRNGLTDKQIAENIGISVYTLDKWKRRFVQIRQALKIGHEAANFAVEGKLFKRAMSGNTTAMIFWLKNNWRDKYNDSELSPEERKLAVQRAEKLKADTELAKQKVKMLNENKGSLTKIIFADDLEPDDEDDTDQEGDEDNGTEA